MVSMTKEKGFTLIELLLSVSVLAILSGVVISVISPARQKAVADDAVRQTTLNKLVQGLEAYNASEGAYPTDTSDPTLTTYIASWPDPAIYTYGVPDGIMCVSAPMAATSGKYFKYVSQYDASKTGGVQACGSKILKNCGSKCDSGVTGNDIDDCTTVDGTSCGVITSEDTGPIGPPEEFGVPMP